MRIYKNFNKYLIFFLILSSTIITSRIFGLNKNSFENKINYVLINFLSYIGIFLPSIYFFRENKQKKLNKYVWICLQFYIGLYCMVWTINIFSYLLFNKMLILSYFLFSCVGFVFHSIPISILPIYYQKNKQVLHKNNSSIISLIGIFYSCLFYYSNYHSIALIIFNFIFLDIITIFYLRYNYKVIPNIKTQRNQMDIV